MKKLFSLVAISTLALSTIFTSCKEKEKDPVVESVTLSATTTTTLNVYGTANPATLQLTATVLPANYSDLSLTWESSNNNIASVNETGLVTARNEGQVTIFAFSNADNSKYDSISLTITRGAHPTWGEIKFLTVDTVKVGDQIWSDVVVVENGLENPADYDGGTPAEDIEKDPGVFKVSIVKNQGYGSLFSWQAVNDLKSALCPYPWRVPTVDDFVALDKALGGTGLPNAKDSIAQVKEETPQELLDAYLNTWGATYGGYINNTDKKLESQGATTGVSSYWSSSDIEQPKDKQPYDLARALSITYGEAPGQIMVDPPTQPTPEQIAAGGNPAAWAASCGCPAGTYAMSPSGTGGAWQCIYQGIKYTRITRPDANPEKTRGLMLRCVK